MPDALKLSGLEGLDHATSKAMILAQQDHHASQLASCDQTLSSRTVEIERLKLLVTKLQRLLFGTKSEKVLRQVEQLELQLEELEVASAADLYQAEARSAKPAAAKPFAARFPSIFRARCTRTCRSTMRAQSVGARCATWVKTPRRCSSMCGLRSR